MESCEACQHSSLSPPPPPNKRVRARFQAIRLGLCNEIPSPERPASSLVACNLLNKGTPLPKAIGLHWQFITTRHEAHLLPRSAVTDTHAKVREANEDSSLGEKPVLGLLAYLNFEPPPGIFWGSQSHSVPPRAWQQH